MIDYDNGYFKVISFLESRRNSSGQMKRFWNCLCRCGNFKVLYTREITRKVPKHCGCNYKGLYKHSLYRTWRNIKSRCYNKNVRSYAQYGAKGIGICSEWINSPELFISWSLSAGWKHGLVIDRVDHNGNYSPDNCRFISASDNNKKVHIDNYGLSLGSNNYNAKINEDQVVEIKMMLTNGFTYSQIQKRFNLSREIIYRIKTGKTWKHVKI